MSVIPKTARPAAAGRPAGLVAAALGLTAALVVGTPGADATLAAARRVAPGPPSNLVATVNGFTVSFMWSAPQLGGAATSYVIEAGTAPGSTNALVANIGNTTGFAATSPAPGTFFIAVRAVNADGMSPRSNEVMVTLPGGGVAPPPPPAGVTAQAAGSTVTIAWMGSPSATSYQIQASLSPSGPTIASLPVGGTSLSVPAVPAGTYYLRVIASGPGGMSAPSSEVAVTVGTAPAPLPPTAVNPCVVINAVPLPSAQVEWAPIFQGLNCTGPNSPVVQILLDGGTSICSGTVIADNAVLTAAHCVTGSVRADTVIVGGSRSLPVSSVRPNASYNEAIQESYDLAVVFTAGSLGVPAVPVLLSRSAQPGEMAVFAGYGGDRDQGGTTGVLRAGMNTISRIGPDTITLDFTGQGSNTCGGDSGGPILVRQGSEWVIAGVTARGSGDCEVAGDSIWSNITFPEGAALLTTVVPGVQRR